MSFEDKRCTACGGSIYLNKGIHEGDNSGRLFCCLSCVKASRKADIDIRHDAVNHPKHYTSHGSGVECIKITERMNFCLGNAMKYLWRADLKGGSEDLKKAMWYIEREIMLRAKSEDK